MVVLLALLVPASGALGVRWLRGSDPGGLIGTAFGTDHDRTADVGRDDRASRARRASPAGTATPRHSSSATASPSASPTHRHSPAATRSAHKPAAGSPTVASQVAGYGRRVADEINDKRSAAGCKPLRYDGRLATAARKHSADMARRGYFAHNTPDGTTPWDRIRAEGYGQPSAENIAAGQATPADVVAAWMKSPGHRANILNCSSHAVGVGFYRGGSYGTYWTQDFGRR